MVRLRVQHDRPEVERNAALPPTAVTRCRSPDDPSLLDDEEVATVIGSGGDMDRPVIASQDRPERHPDVAASAGIPDVDVTAATTSITSAVPRASGIRRLQGDGGATGARTPDLLHAMQMLSQLSYRPERHMVPEGLAASGRQPLRAAVGCRDERRGHRRYTGGGPSGGRRRRRPRSEPRPTRGCGRPPGAPRRRLRLGGRSRLRAVGWIRAVQRHPLRPGDTAGGRTAARASCASRTATRTGTPSTARAGSSTASTLSGGSSHRARRPAAWARRVLRGPTPELAE